MKPGDLFEWAYNVDGSVVLRNEHTWSSVMKQWVPIGGIHLLIALADGILTWLPLGALDKGLLHMREDDTRRSHENAFLSKKVAPRARR